jgi:anaerobic selenocysteine-containing dehydrogenase
MTVYTTACPLNCYSTCSMKVLVEKGRIRRIQPHPDNRATPEGVCLKGLSFFERVLAPDRILHPVKRRKGHADFERISWDEAIKILSEKIEAIKSEHGPMSVLYYCGSGTKGLLNAVGMNFWRLYGGCTTTYGDLCWPAGLEATRLTLGENKHNAPWDIATARLIVLWGKNPAETNLHQTVFIDQALEKGAKLIVIDPRRTQSSERAELMIQPRPGTDGALALAVAHLLIRDGRIDQEFIRDHVAGFAEYEEMVKACTPEWASTITDVPAGVIHRLAEAIGTVAPLTVCAGFGMQRYTNSGQTMRALIALLALTGNIGKPGAGWVYANLQTSIFDDVKDPIAFYPPAKQDKAVRVSISTARLGKDMLAADDPPLRMIWVERGNPVTQNPETHTVLKAFRSLDFRVVVDQFLTDTAREADIILPAKTLFEQTDVIGAYWHPYIQLRQKVIEPPSEVKHE